MFEFDKIKYHNFSTNSVALIPARKGSNRIKKKNIKKLDGRPVISYSIKLAIQSKLFKTVIVSTDCKKIAKISQNYGAKIFFLRPKYLSSNNVSTVNVISHFANFLKKNNIKIKYICCIYPVAPLINLDLLKETYFLIKKNIYDYVVPVSTINGSNSTYLQINNNSLVKKVFYKKPKVKKLFLYNDTGQFYWGKFHSWLIKKKIFSKSTRVIKIPKENFIDVNTLADWKELKKLYFKKNYK
jgi:pseudaminic acid cytidylyltransferase